MKKSFSMLVSMALIGTLCGGFTACDDDKNGEQIPAALQYEKRHDTAILLVTFGSTYDEPHTTYENQMAQFETAFPDADIFFSFTSVTCINRWYAASGEQFITPDKWLGSFIEKGYKHVYVQSLHVIPGEEFQLLRDKYVKSDYNFIVQDLEPAREEACCGTALLTSDKDIKDVAKVLVDAFKTQLQAGEAVAFMGHGNPVSDYDHANASYEKIEKEMQAYAESAYKNGNVFVGTVDYPAMLIDYVIDEMKAKGVSESTPVNLHPLMSIAGDHANNDMADANDPESWLSMIEAAGWKHVKPTVKGLGDYKEINAVWIQHLRDAIAE